MWGNTKGWLMSVVVAVVMTALLYRMVAPPPIPEPTNDKRFDVAKKAIGLPDPPDSVTPLGQNGCDAADLYRKAIADYQANSGVYEHAMSHITEVDPADVPAVAEILAARDCSKCRLFAAKPSDVVNYNNDEPPLTALSNTGELCINLGLLAKAKKNTDEARKHFEAAFLLGVHLYEERLSWTELVAAHNLVQKGALNLLKLAQDANDTARAERIQKFISDESESFTAIAEPFKIINHVDEDYAGKYAGDIFAIAQNPSSDVVFRVEAIKHIGHYRYNSLGPGEQLGAKRFLKQLPDQPGLDPVLKTAATAARDLTPEQHRLVGASVE